MPTSKNTSPIRIAGAYTALVTPFRDGQLDESRLKHNVAEQLAAGMTGVVPVGTTGESPTLSHAEHERVIEVTIDAVRNSPRPDAQVIAGTGSNATTEALSLTLAAKKAGADAALMVNPYYNKPSQEGLYRHFMTVADAVDLPIVLYNIPGRTNVTMSADTVARLGKHPNVIAVKEATGSLDLASEILQQAGDNITVISGDDSLTLPLMSIGGTGVISVLGNLTPARVVAMVAAASAGDYDQARSTHHAIFPLCKAMLTLAVNPVVVKTALKLLDRDTGELRLPLCEMPADDAAALQSLLRRTDFVGENS
ncbi:MAG: 4-hydroxy-tetrahydrodipicolinate synthase [Planctomycetota bacterium]